MNHSPRYPAAKAPAFVDTMSDDRMRSRAETATSSRKKTRHRRWRPLSLSLAGVAAVALLLACYWYVIPTNAEGYVIGKRPITIETAGPGLLDATNKVSLSVRTQGRLSRLAVDRNDVVTKGQFLASVDASETENEVAAAKASADAARRSVVEAQNERVRLKSVVEQARADLERKRTLGRSGIVSQVEVNRSEAVVQQASANLDRGLAAIERAQAQALSANANVDALKVRAAESSLQSPFNGVVVSRDKSVGDLILPGMPIMQLVDPSSIIISARFDESTMGTIAPNQSVAIRFASMKGRSFSGKVLRIGRQVDTETREYTVDVSLDSLPENWAIGQRASVSIEVKLPASTVVLPESKLQRRDGRVGAWIYQDGRARWRPVTPGFSSGEFAEVLDGVKTGDVILDPAGRYNYEPISLHKDSP